jgi:diguanylate cyclase (GGDEF)-like protein
VGGEGGGLRIKFTLVLLLVGVVPLVSASLFFYFASKKALFNSVFRELKWSVNEVAVTIESLFDGTGKDLLLASQSSAFRMYFKEPGKKGYWLAEQHKTLEHLRSIYPEILDEACFIDSTGKEICRIVHDELAAEEDLSSEEDRSIFFKEAFGMKEGMVYQGRPMISEDTERWVLPNATPIVVDGRKAAILHFEVTMTYFQRLLDKAINPDRAHGFILNDEGEFMAHTRLQIGERDRFPMAVTKETPEGLKEIYGRMMAGGSGIEEFTEGGKAFYLSYRPVKSDPRAGVNMNKWSIGYVLPADRVYVELSILKYNLLAIGATLLVVIILANLLGKYVTKPIRELAVASTRVALGKLPKIEVMRDDEIGQLSESFNRMVDAVNRRDTVLKELATTDGLTGLYNHRFFKSELVKEVKSALRFNRPLSLLIADVDWFKQYNDTYGHTAGDMALKKISNALLKSTRDVDIAARYGGEEFSIILPEAGIKDALEIAERIRRAVAEEGLHIDKPGGVLTISIGVAELTGGVKDAEGLIKEADKLLYRAKELGRNRVFPDR